MKRPDFQEKTEVKVKTHDKYEYARVDGVERRTDMYGRRGRVMKITGLKDRPELAGTGRRYEEVEKPYTPENYPDTWWVDVSLKSPVDGMEHVVTFDDWQNQLEPVQHKFVDIDYVREEDLVIGKKEDGTDAIRPKNTGAFEPGDLIQITTKIDGANASIAWDETTGKLEAFSRTNLLDQPGSLRGFYDYVKTEIEPKTDWSAYKDFVFFGEWCVKHSVAYNPEWYNKWRVYDIWCKSAGCYVSQERVKATCRQLGLEYIEELYYGPFVSWDHCRSFLKKSTAYGPEQEGCFWSRAKVLMADGTQKPISKIKVGDMVKSFDVDTREIVDRRVSNVFFNGYKPLSDWMTITVFPRGTSGSDSITGPVVCTKNHRFYSENGFIDAEKLKSVSHYGKTFDHFRRQAFLGLMCSDGCYSRRDGMFQINQKTATIGDFTKIFDGFLTKRAQETISGKGSRITTIHFKKQLTEPLKREFVNKKNRFDYIKAFSELDDIGWSYFFMGDGCGSQTKNGMRAVFSLESYSNGEVKKIIDIFKNWSNDIKFSTHKDKRVKSGAGISIHISPSNAQPIFERISKYVLPAFRYKIPEQLRSAVIEYPSGIQYGISDRIPYKISIHPLKSLCTYGHKTIGAWDLEIEKTHTYFVNGCLVHNCVVKNQDKLAAENRTAPAYIKIVSERFKESHKVKAKREPSPEEAAAKERGTTLAASVATEARVRKIILKLVDEGILPAELGPKDMGTVMKHLAKRVFDDVLKEEPETVKAIGAGAGKFISAEAAKQARKIVLGR